MVFLVAAVLVGVVALIFAFQGVFESFMGGAALCVLFIVCWIFQKKRKRGEINTIQNLTTEPDNHCPAQSCDIVKDIKNRDDPQKPNRVSQPSEQSENEIHKIDHIQYKSENHHVTGTSYRQKEIESLGEENPVYGYSKKEFIEDGYEDEKVYYYDFNPQKVELIEEPDNEFDPNAIKVVIDNVFVGYIKKGSCTHVKNLLKSGKIVKVDAEIYGGEYKQIYSEYDEDKNEDVYEVNADKSDYFVTIEIKYLV